MNLDRRSRIALGLMLLALLALAVDRLVLPPPRAAVAAGPSGDDSARPAEFDTDPALPPPEPERRVPPADFETSDVFALSRIGVQAIPPKDAAARLNAESFSAVHVLRGTLLGPSPAALLDRRQVRVGQSVDGYRLIEVKRDAAVFSDGVETVELRLMLRRAP